MGWGGVGEGGKERRPHVPQSHPVPWGPALCRELNLSARPVGPGSMKAAKFMFYRREGK